jgi:hypothetical protein
MRADLLDAVTRQSDLTAVHRARGSVVSLVVIARAGPPPAAGLHAGRERSAPSRRIRKVIFPWHQ